ncbi:MAG: ATP-binding protein [Candidatus Omnitrophica bacterium]|nr:ATP-binding protein [Candidatus Omnitrophota bacterium]
MIKRALESKVLAYARKFPVVTITGPRQSGKTTLCKMAFPDKKYLSLEDLDVRNYARTDPRSFLEETLKKGAVLDEIQRVPKLLSYIQTIADRENREGLFILTGSQNFELLHSLSQTLAGRTALATLLPFSYGEIYKNGSKITLDTLLYKGFYPRIYDKKLNPTEALSFYTSTYLERDVRSLINIKDLSKFEVFLKLCASKTGQVLNISNLGNDCGINHNTAKSWLSVLEASYIIHLVRPHHKNFRKRLIKSPKLYFIDSGLAAYLLDIHNARHMANHPLKGAIFETFVVSEVLKARLNGGKRKNLYYFRDNVGNEVDLILDYGSKVKPVEIKLGRTINNDFFNGLRYYKKLNPKNSAKGCLIYGAGESSSRSKFDIISYNNIGKMRI